MGGRSGTKPIPAALSREEFEAIVAAWDRKDRWDLVWALRAAVDAKRALPKPEPAKKKPDKAVRSIKKAWKRARERSGER